MPLINSLIHWVNIKRINQIDLFKRYPQDVQNEVLANLLVKAKNTEIGQKYKFDIIESAHQFAETVPVVDYDGFKHYVERIMQGQQNIIWPTEIKWFAKSSGTTSDKSKFIPVSRESLEECHYKGGRDVVALYLKQYPDSEIFLGKTLALGGSHKISEFNSDLYYGDLSAVLMQNLPFWAEFLRTPTLDIALMDEWESKIEKIANETIKHRVSVLAGVPSWMMVLIKRILEITGKTYLDEVWPQLELFIHGGVSFEPYRDYYRSFFNNKPMRYMETYNASEGFFAIQDNLFESDMLLMLDLGVYYEFIPMEYWDSESPKTLTIGEVELNKPYALVISTNSGLWRYKIGDTIKFTSLYPHKIKITGRTKHFINAFGEELMVENAEYAVRWASEKTGAVVCEYTAAPIFMNERNTGSHEWIFEFEKEPSNMQTFMEELDWALKTVNSDYEAKRYKNITLSFPKWVVVKSGTFYQWLKSKNKLGGQHKVPRLANHREYVEELKEIHYNNCYYAN
ncbi:MAG: GH3 auxin-responsive promoter family protein [Bacteroidales bacterium]|nr:GH3 auxin-responsive promoter family protein [Bacteroidales bacterium]